MIKSLKTLRPVAAAMSAFCVFATPATADDIAWHTTGITPSPMTVTGPNIRIDDQGKLQIRGVEMMQCTKRGEFDTTRFASIHDTGNDNFNTSNLVIVWGLATGKTVDEQYISQGFFSHFGGPNIAIVKNQMAQFCDRGVRPTAPGIGG